VKEPALFWGSSFAIMPLPYIYVDTEAESAQLSLSTCSGVLKQLAEMERLGQNLALKAAANDIP
jgi:hypothetical protein